MDRFVMKVDVDYTDEADEVAMLGLTRAGLASATLDDVTRVTDVDELRELRAQVDATRVSDELARYVVSVVRMTRELPSVSLGGSPRATVHLLAAARAAARLAGRDFVTPDDVVRMAPAVLRHRVVLTPDAELDRQRPDDAVAAALDAIPVPR